MDFLLGGRAQGPSSVKAFANHATRIYNFAPYKLSRESYSKGLKLMVIFNCFLALNSIISIHSLKSSLVFCIKSINRLCLFCLSLKLALFVLF